MRPDGVWRWSLAVAIHIAGVAAIALLDVQLNSGVLFAPFYLIPVLTSSYGLGRAAGVLVAIAASIGWSFTAESAALASDPVVVAWNSLSRAAIYLTLALIVDLFAREHRRALRSAGTDDLTSLLNARALHARLGEELDRARRYERPVSLLYVDSDQLKSINDRFGHGAGDRVLIGLADRLRADRRSSDLVARLGGDEFVIVLPETDRAGAQLTAARVRSAVAAHAFEVGPGTTVTVTVSIGIAGAEGGIDASELLRRADMALYQAKRGGRDRAVLWSEAARPIPASATPKTGPREPVAFLQNTLKRLRAAFGNGRAHSWPPTIRRGR